MTPKCRRARWSLDAAEMWLTQVPRIYLVSVLAQGAVGNPLHLRWKSAGSDPGWLIPWCPHQTTALCYCHVVLLSIVTVCCCSEVWQCGQLSRCRPLALKAEGGSNAVERCPKRLWEVKTPGEKMHYPEVGFTFKVLLCENDLLYPSRTKLGFV